ncbi:hypothetical protein D9619_010335 [Psilocybe cf. subviscida]|uniref:Uncharacterized protein n=1 Tax=Psilocybe cf. subviscida TaxID=2480587 RepID=A0A8H5AT39_9AGAR|nr:hypothetical protein D9619_010335 [Psilocybe cf. subviscida]
MAIYQSARTLYHHGLRRFAQIRLRTSNAEPPQYHEGPIETSAPVHTAYVLLHAPRPPAEFPTKYNTRLSLELAMRAKKWGATVNFSWLDAQTALGATEERQSATVFSERGGRLEIPHVSLQNLNEVEAAISEHVQRSAPTELTPEEVHIYVCTHGARDCRCGERGKEVVEALRRSVTDPRIKIGEVGHVGGHKWAANLLVFPQGEWLGLVKPEDVPSINSWATNALEQGARPLRLSDPPSFPAHWRGRMGLSKEEQKDLLAKYQT